MKRVRSVYKYRRDSSRVYERKKNFKLFRNKFALMKNVYFITRCISEAAAVIKFIVIFANFNAKYSIRHLSYFSLEIQTNCNLGEASRAVCNFRALLQFRL